MFTYKILLVDGTPLYLGNDPAEADTALDLIYADGALVTLSTTPDADGIYVFFAIKTMPCLI